MKKNSLLLLGFAVVAFLGFQSCDKDDDPKPAASAIVKEIEIDASAYDKWTYFSFEKGEVVGNSGVEEKRSGTDWDIAFHRWDVRLNCGESGSGKGGALLIKDKVAKTGWDAVVSSPETGYKVDEMIKATKDISSMPPVQVNVSGSNVITGGSIRGQSGKGTGSWMNMKYGNQGPEYIVTNQIFVVKTADGKYAKAWLKQYKSDKGSGHITMKYAYQKDGSTKLD